MQQLPPEVMTQLVKLSNEVHALTASFQAFRELMDERDRRYAELDNSNKSAIKAAFESAERMTEKTETALKEYKVGANEWRDTVKDLIASLKQSQSKEIGKDEALEIAKMTQRWMIGLAVTGIFFVVATLTRIFL